MVRIYNVVATVLLCFIFISCNTSGPKLFGKQNLHEQYGRKITDAGLKETALGKQWFAAAAQAISQPINISLPYKEVGFFSADKPRAVGIRFSGKRGEKLLFQLEKRSLDSFILFADLWRLDASANPTLIKSIDTSQYSFDLEVDENSSYILRLQPELLRSGDYTLSIAVGPSLGFPVAGKSASVGSVWGDPRDAGGRKHEGIDIFAPKRTPVIAAADGTVSRVNDNNLGGKVVWLRPSEKSYTLYYAHLDEQLATAGQRVKKGDTIGLVGNTGNARSTPPHLHFGIYTFGGAVDPLPFVSPVLKKPADVIWARQDVSVGVRLSTATQLSTTNFSNHYEENTLMFPVAATASQYHVWLPDNTFVAVPKNIIRLAKSALKQITIKDTAYLLDSPFANAPIKGKVDAGTQVAIYGFFKDFVFVSQKADSGWLPSSILQ